MAHSWNVSTRSVQGEYGGKVGKVYPAKCMNHGCGATATFPVFPNDFVGMSPSNLGPCKDKIPGNPGLLADAPVVGEGGSKNPVGLGRGGGAANVARGRYYEEHKDEIIADFLKLGQTEALKKWNMPLTSWHRLNKRWKTYEDAGHNGNGHSGNSNWNGSSLVSATMSSKEAMSNADFRKRLSFVLRRLADEEGPTEMARGLRLAAMLTEVA